MKKSTNIEIICGLLILLFVYTAVSKLLAYTSFVAVLDQSPLMQGKAGVIGWLLPTVELFVSILLFLPSTKEVGLYLSFGLMVLFTAYIAYMVMFTPHLPCSCGGVIKQLSWKQHLVFNAFFILVAFAGIIMFRNKNLAKHQTQ
ncbi:MauE/DoxX family redox-associated membrane protein [Parasediminibacterium paludis]|uniref:MauE/DoxX family redox-associated membrane protein n=1 Tax=Parasediminibacterium paludis TaxID=908966 RepID=A0ABV8PZ91_9BACT